jgi:hypothetical protein
MNLNPVSMQLPKVWKCPLCTKSDEAYDDFVSEPLNIAEDVIKMTQLSLT